MTEPQFVGVLVPSPIVEQVKRKLEEEHVQGTRPRPLAVAVKEEVEALLANPVSQVCVSSPDVDQSDLTLHQACEVIMKELDPAHQRLIRLLAGEKRLPIEAFVFSALVRTHDRGETAIILHDWLNKAPVLTPPPPVGDSVCEYCQQPFTASYVSQRFCPPPADESDSCGRKWAVAQARAAVERKRRPASPFAPPPSPVVRKAIDRPVNKDITMIHPDDKYVNVTG